MAASQTAVAVDPHSDVALGGVQGGVVLWDGRGGDVPQGAQISVASDFGLGAHVYSGVKTFRGGESKRDGALGVDGKEHGGTFWFESLSSCFCFVWTRSTQSFLFFESFLFSFFTFFNSV